MNTKELNDKIFNNENNSYGFIFVKYDFQGVEEHYKFLNTVWDKIEASANKKSIVSIAKINNRINEEFINEIVNMYNKVMDFKNIDLKFEKLDTTKVKFEIPIFEISKDLKFKDYDLFESLIALKNEGKIYKKINKQLSSKGIEKDKLDKNKYSKNTKKTIKCESNFDLGRDIAKFTQKFIET